MAVPCPTRPVRGLPLFKLPFGGQDGQRAEPGFLLPHCQPLGPGIPHLDSKSLPARFIIGGLSLSPPPHIPAASLDHLTCYSCKITRLRTSAQQVADVCLAEGLTFIECGHQPFLRSTESLKHAGLGGRSPAGCSFYLPAPGAHRALHIHCLLPTTFGTRQGLPLIPLYIR